LFFCTNVARANLIKDGVVTIFFRAKILLLYLFDISRRISFLIKKFFLETIYFLIAPCLFVFPIYCDRTIAKPLTSNHLGAIYFPTAPFFVGGDGGSRTPSGAFFGEAEIMGERSYNVLTQ
jgi:hypothetical protein